MQYFLATLNKERSALQDQISSLEKDRALFEEEKRRMVKIVKESDVIDLNVGGKKIAVKRSTLTQVKGSLLEVMFSGRWEEMLERDKDGNVFLEFNPYCFNKVVDFLRAKRIETPDRPTPVPVVASDQQAEFNNLITYLGLDGTIQEVIPKIKEVIPKIKEVIPKVADHFDPINKSPQIILKHNNLVACNPNAGHHYVLGNLAHSSGVIEWTLKVTKMLSNHWMMLGVQNVASAITIDNSYNNDGCYGWSKNSSQVYVRGKCKSSHNGYDGSFLTGDSVVLKLDIPQGVLSFSNQRIGKTWTMSIPGNTTWKLHSNLAGKDDEIQLVSTKYSAM